MSAAPPPEPAREDSASELNNLLSQVTPLITAFIAQGQRSADQNDNEAWRPGTLTQGLPPNELVKELIVVLPKHGQGAEGLLRTVDAVLMNSVNTWHQGFMDKLYASTNAVGVISEMLLAVLNTNSHVYTVSPALTVIEKTVGKELASLFGLTGPNAGGISQPGGSGANLTALVIARNTIFPKTKTQGLGQQRYVLFTSSHGHYSFEKAAQICGFGSDAVRSVAVDEDGRMIVQDLEHQIEQAKQDGFIPFFCNATAGTTVLGSYDPIDKISAVCRKHKLWLHVDASWGGPAVFAPSQRWKLEGSAHADSITVNPHKLLGVPITCSFLLAQNLRSFWKSNTLPAGYLFHSGDDREAEQDEKMPEVWDLADISLQCGRKSDALKLALSWIYFGTEGLAMKVENAFAVASELAKMLAAREGFHLECKEPACLQVCFYRRMKPGDKAFNSATTKRLAQQLVAKSFLIDYAPGKHGLMLRVVCSLVTQRSTIKRLVETIEELS